MYIPDVRDLMFSESLHTKRVILVGIEVRSFKESHLNLTICSHISVFFRLHFRFSLLIQNSKFMSSQTPFPRVMHSKSLSPSIPCVTLESRYSAARVWASYSCVMLPCPPSRSSLASSRNRRMLLELLERHYLPVNPTWRAPCNSLRLYVCICKTVSKLQFWILHASLISQLMTVLYELSLSLIVYGMTIHVVKYPV